MPEIIIQKIRIEAVCYDIFKELVSWGQSSWWPKNTLTSIENLSGTIDVGTRYRQQVKLPFGPNWCTVNKVIDKKNLYIRRDFFGNMFDGFEELTVVPDEDGHGEINYTFAAELKGGIAKFFWKNGAKKMHTDNITMILSSLKEYLEKRK
jgi:hypothetical protein